MALSRDAEIDAFMQMVRGTITVQKSENEKFLDKIADDPMRRIDSEDGMVTAFKAGLPCFAAVFAFLDLLTKTAADSRFSPDQCQFATELRKKVLDILNGKA